MNQDGTEQVKGNRSAMGHEYIDVAQSRGSGYDLRIPSGVVKPSGYAEYDGWTGYLVGTYSYEWTDRQGNRWRTACEVVNLGRPDRGIPVNPDAMLKRERWQEPRASYEVSENGRSNLSANAIKAIEGHKRKKRERAAAIHAEIVKYIRQHGPSTSAKLSAALGRGYWYTNNHLVGLEGVSYKRVGEEKRAVLWGLMG